MARGLRLRCVQDVDGENVADRKVARHGPIEAPDEGDEDKPLQCRPSILCMHCMQHCLSPHTLDCVPTSFVEQGSTGIQSLGEESQSTRWTGPDMVVIKTTWPALPSAQHHAHRISRAIAGGCARGCRPAHLQKLDDPPHAEQPQDKDDVEGPPSGLIWNCQHHDLRTTHISGDTCTASPHFG